MIAPKITDYYEVRGHSIGKMVERRPEGLTSDQVEEAAIRLYVDLHNGESVRDIDITRRVWAKAREIRTGEYRDNMERAEIAEDRVGFLNMENDNLKWELKANEIKSTIAAVLYVWSAVIYMGMVG